MTHPITPPQELVQQWLDAIFDEGGLGVDPHKLSNGLAACAARWGADRELEACCAWLPQMSPWSGKDLRKHRRPKPPSLKEQALETLKYPKDLWSEAEVDTIRRALEALPDD